MPRLPSPWPRAARSGQALGRPCSPQLPSGPLPECLGVGPAVSGRRPLPCSCTPPLTPLTPSRREASTLWRPRARPRGRRRVRPRPLSSGGGWGRFPESGWAEPQPCQGGAPPRRLPQKRGLFLVRLRGEEGALALFSRSGSRACWALAGWGGGLGLVNGGRSVSALEPLSRPALSPVCLS